MRPPKRVGRVMNGSADAQLEALDRQRIDEFFRISKRAAGAFEKSYFVPAMFREGGGTAPTPPTSTSNSSMARC